MLIFHKGHTDTIQVYSVTVMTHVKALQAGHSSQGTSEPITPVLNIWIVRLFLDMRLIVFRTFRTIFPRYDGHIHPFLIIFYYTHHNFKIRCNGQG